MAAVGCRMPRQSPALVCDFNPLPSEIDPPFTFLTLRVMVEAGIEKCYFCP
jgi:hypothetical protein